MEKTRKIPMRTMSAVKKDKFILQGSTSVGSMFKTPRNSVIKIEPINLSIAKKNYKLSKDYAEKALFDMYLNKHSRHPKNGS
jgi:hypothetical protein